MTTKTTKTTKTATAAAWDAAYDAAVAAYYAVERREQLALFRAIVERPAILAEVAP